MFIGFGRCLFAYLGGKQLISIRKSSTRLMATVQPAVEKRSLIDLKPSKPVKKPKLKKYKAKKVDSTSPLGVLQYEIDELLASHQLDRERVLNDVTAILNDKVKDETSITSVYHREVSNVNIVQLTSSGDGLAIISNPVDESKRQVAVVPFGLPGDCVTVKVFKTHPHFVECDLLKVESKSDIRKDGLISCKYFGKCSGCQFQFLDYSKQLELKRNTVINAYKYFAPLLVEKGLLPQVGDTIGSPLQYGYRTKLTPHFDLPRKLKKLQERPPLGFGQKGRPKWRDAKGGNASILDIEECPIGTEILNVGMANERQQFDSHYGEYKKGATILLREHTQLIDPTTLETDEGSKDASGKVSKLVVESNGQAFSKICVTNTRQVVSEYIDGYKFQFSAGEFFQNNNSILPLVTKYVRENLQIPNSGPEDPNYLVDAYCGSGLFSICSSKGVSKVTGVEISADSVAFAEKNAKANGVENCRFIVGKAEKLFESIDTPNDRTSVILDPPRKGCDELFLDQLAAYYPARVVYISCNVHSQARDMQYFLESTEKGKEYKIESLRGFDFFPQTHHVESVCVLSRI